MIDINALSAYIKITDIKRMVAYEMEDYQEYQLLSARYNELVDQYFKEIKTRKQLDFQMQKETEIIRIDRRKNNAKR